ncbi:MAG: YeeE/YedE family protein [Deltaproteobacteria bacterium]|nr:YeeE/YedE family protein [Deltaproteobacteria bacterium]
MQPEWINALIGGAIIGISVSVMLLFNGRVTGISGIINGALTPQKGDTLWRVLFILGLVLGGFTLRGLNASVFEADMATSDWTTVVAGLLVGFGTIMGSGCTSGHGVCGISRMSIRSIVSTVTFIAAGVAAVALFRQLGIF